MKMMAMVIIMYQITMELEKKQKKSISTGVGSPTQQTIVIVNLKHKLKHNKVKMNKMSQDNIATMQWFDRINNLTNEN